MRRIIQVVGCGAVSLALAGCWPVPGQNAGRTAHNPSETGITSANVADLTQQWASVMSGRVGSPVVSTGGVHVVHPPCLLTTVNPTTGAKLWSATTTGFVLESCGQFVDVTSGDPYVIGDDVYVGAEAVGVSLNVCNGFTRGFDLATGTVISDVADGALEAFRDLEDPPNLVVGTDCVFDEELGQRVRSGTLGQLRDQLQDVHVPGGFAQTTVGAHGDVYDAGPGLLATQPGDLTRGDGIRAYDADLFPMPSCGVDGVETCPRWAVPTDGEVRGHPVVEGTIEQVYAGTNAGIVYAIEGTSGAVRWTASVGAPVTASLALAGLPGSSGGALYVPTANGRIVVLDASTGEQLWESSTGTGSGITVQPAVAGDVLYAGSADGTVGAFAATGCGAPTCGPLWSTTTGSEITGAPAVSNGQLYVGTADGRLIAYGFD